MQDEKLREQKKLREEIALESSLKNPRTRIILVSLRCPVHPRCTLSPTPSGVTITQSSSHVHIAVSLSIHARAYPRVHTIGSEPKLVLHRRHHHHLFHLYHLRHHHHQHHQHHHCRRRCPSLAESRIPAQQRPAPTSHCVPDAREYRREEWRRRERRGARRKTGEIDIAWVDVQRCGEAAATSRAVGCNGGQSRALFLSLSLRSSSPSRRSVSLSSSICLPFFRFSHSRPFFQSSSLPRSL